MLTRAVDAFESGQYADALIAVEYVCRTYPNNSLPAILRAKILQACRPELTTRAWYRAWCCEPENVNLQNVMLQAWLASGAAASVADLGPAFLPARCRNGQHRELIAMLRQAGVRHVGACWKAGDVIEAMLFTEVPTDGTPHRARLFVSDGSAQYEYEVPANGSRFRLPCPRPDGVWSLAFAGANGAAPQLLHGSPLVFKEASAAGAPAAHPSFLNTTASVQNSTTTSLPNTTITSLPNTTTTSRARSTPTSFPNSTTTSFPNTTTTSFPNSTPTSFPNSTPTSFPRRREPNFVESPRNGIPATAETTDQAALNAANLAAMPIPPRRAVSIVIPVYRDQALVQACINSVLASLAHNNTPAGVLVIDDASPEPALSAWLDQLAASGRITLLRNRYNLGFIETVNRGMRHHPACDVLLLNADTLVHGDWIDRLCAALHSAADIASVTPWSNNGEISSFPKIAAATPAPSAAQLAKIDTVAATLRRDGHSDDVELPSCCGFTMLIRRSVLDEIGMLDGVGLIRGYGEEVDWCLRARAAGYRHLAATGVFVAHTGTVSFRFEKTLRVRQNRAVLAARYPNYHPEYQNFIRYDPLASARSALRDALTTAGSDWLAAAVNLIEGNADRGRALPSGLPSGSIRVAVWRHRRSGPGAEKILALARLLAGESGATRPLRLLVIGEASEALWRSGVVDVLPSSIWQESTLLTDAALVGLAGCGAVLSAPGQLVPIGIAHTIVDDDFEPEAWLSRWRAQQRPGSRASIKKKQIA